jgi:hypothetical protein
MPVFDLKNATLEILDGSTNSLEIKLGDGTFSFSETQNREYIMNRGKLYSVRDGDETPVDISFNFIWEYLKADTGNPPSVRDALYKINNASTWVSSDSDACNPYAVDLRLTLDHPCTEDKKEVYYFSDFRQEKLDFDAKGNSVSCSGKSNATRATVTRTT